MTKKFFQGLFAFFVAAVLSVSLTACPDDPVTPEPGNPSGSTASAFSIVGTWRCDWVDDGDPGYTLVTFNSNGTGVQQDYWFDGKKWHAEGKDDFNYTIIDKEVSETGNQLITLKLDYKLGYARTMEVEVLSSNKVKAGGEIFIKQ